MGFGSNDKQDEIIVEPKEKSTGTTPVPPDFPDDRLTPITVTANGEEKQIRVTDTCRVKPVKVDFGMPDARPQYTDDTGKTMVLNDDDRITDYLDAEDTLTLKPDTVFG